MVAFGLMQHEGKLSVVNFGLKKVAGYTEVVRNKEELLLCTGGKSGGKSCEMGGKSGDVGI